MMINFIVYYVPRITSSDKKEQRTAYILFSRHQGWGVRARGEEIWLWKCKLLYGRKLSFVIPSCRNKHNKILVYIYIPSRHFIIYIHLSFKKKFELFCVFLCPIFACFVFCLCVYYYTLGVIQWTL